MESTKPEERPPKEREAPGLIHTLPNFLLEKLHPLRDFDAEQAQNPRQDGQNQGAQAQPRCPKP